MNLPETKTKYKFIHFVNIGENAKPPVWSCRNNRSGEELGIVKWYSRWRQCCYFPTVQAVYSQDCLADIEHFLNQNPVKSLTPPRRISNE